MKATVLRNVRHKALIYVIVAVGLIWTLFPVYWMVKTSVTPDALMYDAKPKLLPTAVTGKHYSDLFHKTEFMTNIKNSLLVSLLATVISLVISIFGSYSLTRLKFRGRSFVTKSIIICYLMPAAVLFIPMYVLVSKLGFADNKYGLLIIYPTFIVPYCCYMLLSYFKAIPEALEEAALIDGCTRLQTLRKIILPLAAPGIAVVATFAFTMSWNEFLYALVVTTSPSQLTAMVGIASFKFSDSFIWGLLMSSSVIASIPALILYLGAQTFVIGGLADGGTKY
ncbi:carbohydrate ABC transporter permease [Paenibacillus cremeus]|uniref:Carbohydrate ABC transporter permease n=1 Tax=Paenibacillus cremeus TaxID=2163881 RepID=A0A559K602_9BACL|nr:carbohydrate ABC transporter permease [Paenibacillus cremeus]TVY07571.1 carbohydrate ABC transporter permease [Paenibacillus cremeus]